MGSVDHLVVLAASLAEGEQWCSRRLGVRPEPGGEHALMGTHNLLLNVSGAGFARTYLEIIAVKPGAHPARAAGQQRWFDMDTPALQARVSEDGPQLIHFVAAVSGLRRAVDTLAALRLERGTVLRASRQSGRDLLSWQITVRDDGQRLFFGGLPTLIEWDDPPVGGHAPPHPVDALPPCGITLRRLEFHHPRPEALTEAYHAIGLTGVAVNLGAPNLVATLSTPLGKVTLESKGA